MVDLDFTVNMTFEELSGEFSQERMDSVAKALEEVLVSALPQGGITVGVYEAAKSLNVDPDNVVLCILATDDEDVKDVALQIHFTLIQAFCCENDINILRVNNTRRLAQILGGAGGGSKQNGGEPMDLHCVLVTSPQSTSWKDPALSKVNGFCRESRCMDQWVPIINLPDR
ncbi:growth arrest and DNA-damage-inducible, alpha, a [Gadus morhua]|uniref:Growth arrest and DNA damage-inducible protein GADD45 alpha n=1 Tax=Gadus morhua TaxID=8049 RepID=A0A8C4ZMP0_GADMO|nr:growth arrest and DNA damage-inducible protein GADD45 alpha [Gadus morhua]XP_056452395.1 growth arrest and DNA-damage-inducible, alpha, a [Gadus chalcogrammus]XP_059915629.1 growth arrest and DNA-damage-inducible, alpha, a [Gadus macrocephalus]